MVKKKRIKKKKKPLRKPKLPPNDNFWLTTCRSHKDIKDFVSRGNERQRKYMKLAIDYRLWQIQEGVINKGFFGELDVSKLNFSIKVVKRKQKKTVKKKVGKVIDLFDMNNIDDLVKEKV